MSMFKKAPAAPDAAILAAENPYLSARRRWNDYTGGVAESRRVWQLFALMSLLVALVAVAGAVAIGAQSKFVPYVVQVDKLGEPLASGPIDVAPAADPRVIKAQVADFIASARLVTPDVQLQRQAIFRVFAMLAQGDAGYAKVNNYFRALETNPAERMTHEVVATEIVSVIQQSPTSWQVDWNEQIYQRTGEPKAPPARWRALVTVRVSNPTPDTPEAQLRMNPLGVYVADYSWSKIS
jgi:type IV secretion system protein TrbF